MVLSKRLQCIADYIRPGDRIVDVGTDHAYIPIWLLKKDPDTSAIATDIRSGPLDRARADAERYGVADRLKLLLCDGLALCESDSVDTVILAGMGGETMIGILESAPWTLEKHLILQPQTKQAELRAWLTEHGYAINDASLVHDNGRLYLVWQITAGEMPPFHGVDEALLRKQDALLKPYLEEQIKRLRKQLNGVAHAQRDEEGLGEKLRAELDELETVYQEVKTWQA